MLVAMRIVCFVVDNFANHRARNAKGVGQQLKRRKGVGEISLANHLYLLLGDQLLYGSSWCAWHTDRILVIWELSTEIGNLGIKILIAEMGIRGAEELWGWYLTLGTRILPAIGTPLAIPCAVAFCDILMLRHCCRMRQSQIANSQNENSQIATFFHNENSHNATTSHYEICCRMKQRLNMRIVAYCDNTTARHCHWFYVLIPLAINAFFQIGVSHWNNWIKLTCFSTYVEGK